jgi:hypothetical protein
MFPNKAAVRSSRRLEASCGAEWDLSTGKRMAFTSPFRSVAIDDEGKLQVQLIRQELKPFV